MDTARLVALYRAADVMLVTPVCDGMNLVAKEFATCRDDEDGVLVLSSRAGAAAELHAAVLTDLNDLDDLVRAYRVVLGMSAAERRIRMRHLRLTVETHDVFQWSKRFLEALGARWDTPTLTSPVSLMGKQRGRGSCLSRTDIDLVRLGDEDEPAGENRAASV